MPGSLPEGWRRLAIEEMACQRAEKIRPSRDDQTPYVALEHIPNGGGRLLGADVAGSAMSHKTRFLAGDTLFGKLRPNLRKVVRARFDGVCSTDILAVTPKDGTDAAFLYQLLASDVIYRHVMGDITGTKMPRTSWERLADLSVSCPPLSEQRAIAAVLDAVDDTMERTEAVIAATEELRRALLHELLTRGVPGMHSEWKHVPGLGTVPACWEVTTLGELLSELRYGTSTKLSSQGEWPVLRIPNVAQGFVDLADLKYADLTEREADSLELQPGDLLIVRTNGNPDICGASAVWQGAAGRWAFASYLLRLRVRAAILNSTFLWMYLRSVAGRTQLAGSIRTSAGNYNLSAGGLRAMLVPVPPLEEQNLMQGIVHGFDAAEVAERDALSDAKMLKAALADALLSGRVQYGAAFIA